MTSNNMHTDEILVDDALVKQLLNTQFKHWAGLPIKRVKSDGTDNVIYRLGQDMCIRLPRLSGMDEQVKKEQRWLPYLASLLPLDIPKIIGKGTPEATYPSHWSIYRWLEGGNATIEPILQLNKAAVDLAHFINALHKVDPAGGPSTYRGQPLATRTDEVHIAIDSLHSIIDTQAALSTWETCLQVPEWDKGPVWIHSDLLPANLIVQDGKITAVIDFGMMGVGDPACDLLPAWSLFDTNAREHFRKFLDIDDATWIRGQGWALSIGLIILPYYLNTNPGLVAIGKRMINEVLLDFKP